MEIDADMVTEDTLYKAEEEETRNKQKKYESDTIDINNGKQIEYHPLWFLPRHLLGKFQPHGREWLKHFQENTRKK